MMKAFWFSFVLVFDVLALFYVFGQQPAKLNNLTQSDKVIKTDIAQESTSSERNNDLNETDFVEVKYRPQAATVRLKRASYKMPYKMAYKTAYKTKSIAYKSFGPFIEEIPFESSEIITRTVSVRIYRSLPLARAQRTKDWAGIIEGE